MNNSIDKIITAFFVIVFGIPWFFSRKRDRKPKEYRIVIYDTCGKETKIDGLRVVFNTWKVAYSFKKYYQNMFPHYNFVFAVSDPSLQNDQIFQ